METVRSATSAQLHILQLESVLESHPKYPTAPVIESKMAFHKWRDISASGMGRNVKAGTDKRGTTFR